MLVSLQHGGSVVSATGEAPRQSFDNAVSKDFRTTSPLALLATLQRRDRKPRRATLFKTSGLLWYTRPAPSYNWLVQRPMRQRSVLD